MPDDLVRPFPLIKLILLPRFIPADVPLKVDLHCRVRLEAGEELSLGEDFGRGLVLDLRLALVEQDLADLRL